MNKTKKKIRVGVYISAPFCYIENSKYKGICIELWESIVEKLNYDSVYTKITNADEGIHKVNRKELDILIGGISVTHKRGELVNFSRPFFMNRFAIATTHVGQNFSLLLHFLKHIAIGFIIFLGISFILNYIFIKTELGHIKTSRQKWISSYWQFTIGFLQGEVDITPKTTTGRIIVVFTILLGVVFFSYITASAISSFFSSSFQIIKNSSDLKGKKLISTTGTVNTEIGKKYGALVTENKDPLEYYLKNKEFYGVIDDEAILQYKIDNNQKYHHLRLMNYKVELDELAFAVNKQFPDLEKINDAILYNQDSGITRQICNKYISSLSKYCLL